MREAYPKGTPTCFRRAVESDSRLRKSMTGTTLT
jgi:hypothetical protein